MSAYWTRRKQLSEEHHVDDWLMTYADMITLLLCFFAVFVAIAVPDKVKFEEAKEQVKEHFSGDAQRLKGMYPLPRVEKDNPPPTANVPFEALPSIVDRYNEAAPEQKDIEIEKGDRITTIEMNSAPFFDKGSASLNVEGVKVLGEIQPALLSDEYKDYTIAVEGYTDDSPIKTPQFPSNWELSTARAAAVVRTLIDLGVPAERLRATGFGETSPKVPNRDTTGKPLPENQAQNRRVVIRLEKITKGK
jgi:chemotaxis protein MotB